MWDDLWERQAYGPDWHCEHKWVSHERWLHRGTVAESAQVGATKNPNAQITNAKTTSQFCQKCNAWRGSLGLEPDPNLYIQHIVQVFREIWRVLRKDGTVWLNLGDSYAGTGSKHSNGKEVCAQPKRPKLRKFNGGGASTWTTREQDFRKTIPGLKPKDLCGIPWRVALALQADGWWLRSDIIWAKPNPMPESVTDRPTRSHEYVFLLTKSAKYFYDADAVREPHADTIYTQERYKYKPSGRSSQRMNPGVNKNGDAFSKHFGEGGRNLRSVWTIATQPFKDAHFATFPEALVIPCIKAGTSEKGCCPECGAPWVRVVEKTVGYEGDGNPDSYQDRKIKGSQLEAKRKGDEWYKNQPQSKTIGWRASYHCQEHIKEYGIGRKSIHHDPIPCTVLDPFGGSGRTAIVAKKLGRKCVIIELKGEYCEMPLDELRQETIF